MPAAQVVYDDTFVVQPNTLRLRPGANLTTGETHLRNALSVQEMS
jgi:hypothetical protein